MGAKARTAPDVSRRRETILELLHRHGEVSVAELSKRTEVSSMTVRRDLEVLEQDGVLLRVHGGAISLDSRGYAPPFSVRATTRSAEKAAIGQAVASLLPETETVIIDVGTTALEVAKALRGRRKLTVLTPSLHVANVLARERGIRLMLTGGAVAPGELSLVGDFATQLFSKLRIETFVMGVAGIDAEAGCTEFSLDDALVKRAALRSVSRCIVAADSSKLGIVQFAQVCPLDRVDVLVTDGGAANEGLAALETAHVEVVIA